MLLTSVPFLSTCFFHDMEVLGECLKETFLCLYMWNKEPFGFDWEKLSEELKFPRSDTSAGVALTGWVIWKKSVVCPGDQPSLLTAYASSWGPWIASSSASTENHPPLTRVKAGLFHYCFTSLSSTAVYLSGSPAQSLFSDSLSTNLTQQKGTPQFAKRVHPPPPPRQPFLPVYHQGVLSRMF